MSEKTYLKLSAVGQRRARIMFWVDVLIGAIMTVTALTMAYYLLRAVLWHFYA